MGTVLTGGTVVNADSVQRADLRLVDEIVEQLGQNLIEAGDEVIDVTGCYLFPGGIDPHTHFDLNPIINIVRNFDFTQKVFFCSHCTSPSHPLFETVPPAVATGFDPCSYPPIANSGVRPLTFHRQSKPKIRGNSPLPV